ncbi:hypothetical protein CoNPh17_CDS0174 [Staphylococcus phage S-CoN_Ph17]|nr:hypothetical protein CoNPh17_CDS0174 [Staphylococcus phage S-CoN_Ph17]
MLYANLPVICLMLAKLYYQNRKHAIPAYILIMEH